MQISTTKAALLAPLTLVAGASDPRGQVSMLGTVLLKTTAGRLSLLCSDSGVVARAMTDCQVGRDGEIAVDVRRLGDLVRAVPDQEKLDLTLEEKGTLLVKAGRSRFRLPTHPAADFPRLTPAKADRMAITLSGKRLGEMIEQVSAFMGIADIRPFLNGALLSLQDGHLWLVATDGYRLAVTREPIPGSEAVPKVEVILPRKTLLLAKKLLGQPGDVKLTLGPSDAQFSLMDGTVIFGKGIEGTYPDWKRVIPAGGHCVTADSGALLDGLSMLDAAYVADEKEKKSVRAVEVTIGKALMALAHGDTGRCEIDCAGDAEEAETIAFNIDYLTDAVSTIARGAGRLRMFYTTHQASMVIRPENGDYPLAVVMPYRK